MRVYDIIQKKRDGFELGDEEIAELIADYVSGKIPDYQMAAFCMAIYFRGMTANETLALTLAIRDSGETLNLSNINGVKADKHSTGGVGDKTTLIVAPIVSALGVKVAKMSGRGLGHTGGTIDKLEAFSGLRTDISVSELESIVNKTGIAVVGQSDTLAPADKMLYALRDVTATVDSIPLIASSIMGKKLAADDDCIVLDVKTGSGSFMKTLEKSRELASLMVDIGKKAGKRIRALITDMDVPLGNAIGNSLEVIEAIDVLKNEGPADLTAVCTALSAHILSLAGYGNYEACAAKASAAIQDGSALKKLAQMVEAQGGDPDWVFDTSHFPKASFSKEVCAKAEGFVFSVDTEGYGTASMLLGAGRSKKDDIIDHSSGVYLKKKPGDHVKKGEAIAVLYTNNEASLDKAEEKILSSTVISSERPQDRQLILDVIE